VKLNGQLVLVTGASSGIGAATAREMARHGANVVLLARRAPELEKVAVDCRSMGVSAHVYPVDLANEQAVGKTAARIKAEVGIPNIIVASAGSGRWLFSEETPPGEAAQMMGATYFSAFYTIRDFMPDMLARKTGRIVIVGSPAAYAVWPGATAYTAARWALRGYAEALRSDLRGTGVGFTLITPGKVSSSYFENNPGTLERLPGLGRTIPTLTPNQVAVRLVKAVERGESEVIFPFIMWVYAMFNRLMPRFVSWLIWRTGHRHE